MTEQTVARTLDLERLTAELRAAGYVIDATKEHVSVVYPFTATHVRRVTVHKSGLVHRVLVKTHDVRGKSDSAIRRDDWPILRLIDAALVAAGLAPAPARAALDRDTVHEIVSLAVMYPTDQFGSINTNAVTDVIMTTLEQAAADRTGAAEGVNEK